MLLRQSQRGTAHLPHTAERTAISPRRETAVPCSTKMPGTPRHRLRSIRSTCLPERHPCPVHSPPVVQLLRPHQARLFVGVAAALARRRRKRVCRRPKVGMAAHRTAATSAFLITGAVAAFGCSRCGCCRRDRRKRRSVEQRQWGGLGGRLSGRQCRSAGGWRLGRCCCRRCGRCEAWRQRQQRVPQRWRWRCARQRQQRLTKSRISAALGAYSWRGQRQQRQRCSSSSVRRPNRRHAGCPWDRQAQAGTCGGRCAGRTRQWNGRRRSKRPQPQACPRQGQRARHAAAWLWGCRRHARLAWAWPCQWRGRGCGCRCTWRWRTCACCWNCCC